MRTQIKTRSVSALVLILVSVTGFEVSKSCAAADLQLEGFSYIKAKNFSKALECFETALKEHPKSWMLMQSIGNCQMELGHYDTAITYLQKSIDAGGLHASQCNNMAAVYQRSGHPEKSWSWLKLACSLDPAKAADPQTQAIIRQLGDPVNNPIGSLSASDYLSGIFQISKWGKEDMPLKVYIRQNPQIPAFYADFTVMVRESLDQWCKATGNAVSYKFIERPELANLLWDYTDRRELCTSDDELGTEAATDMKIRMKDNRPEQANIVILIKDRPGAVAFRDRVFLTRSCLHEMGHALGMHGHSPNSHDVMFSAATLGGDAKLTERDKTTIWRIYH